MKIRKAFSWVPCGIAALLVAGSGAQTAAIPAVDLSLGPLTVTAQAVNIALALSVEFPTAGAAYRSNTYDHTQEYLGYWDPKGCYEYFDANDISPLKGKYFRRTGSVSSSKYCNTSSSGTGYSGNLLNFAATSSIDLLRYALTGGNRVHQGPEKTVLGRANLPTNFDFPDTNYFPSKRLQANLSGLVTPQFTNPNGSGNYSGIVFFTNCKDFLHVGSSSSGTCTDPSSASNNLGPKVAKLSAIPTLSYHATPPINSSTETFVLDSLGRKRWEQTGETTIIAPTGYDAIAGILVPDVVIPTPRTVTGTSSTPQILGDAFISATLTSGFTKVSPLVGPVTPDITWEPTVATTGIANFEGTAAELTTGMPRTSLGLISKDVCYSGQKNSPTYAKLKANNPTCSKSQTTTIETFRLYTQIKGFKVYALVYETYTSVPTWYRYSLNTAYLVYGMEKVIMKANVQVCDSSEGPSRQGSDGVRFCKRYPNETASSGVYRPIGELQTRAEDVRVSAFGYVLENSNGRYGGVLRAPMKFLGSQYRDINGVLQSNAQAEWDATTGIFSPDPLNAAGGSIAFPAGAPAFTTSGVSNYLNNFGSTGIYKSNDPVGEMYYEVLRYFQGLQPTDMAVASLGTAAAYDNFPIYKTWTDPIENGCQRRNFILAIGDVNTHYDKQLPGHGTGGVPETSTDPARAAQAIPGSSTKTFNALEWTKLLTGFETGVSYPYTDALGRAQNTLGNPNVVSGNSALESRATGSQSSAYYWAGAAYWANTQPIREDMLTVGGKTQSLKDIRVKTFTIDVDEGGNGSIDSNTRGIKPRNSSFFLAGKYGWFNDANDDGNPFKTSGGQINNKEWEDPSLANVPDGYALASQAQRLIAGIRKFFASASAQSGTVSVSSLSSQRFSTSSPDGDLYAPRFDSRDWSGTVIKSSLALNTTTNTIDTLQNVAWDAGSILTAGSTLAVSAVAADPYVKPADRKVFTYRRQVSRNPGIAFTPENLDQLDAVMRNSLNASPATGAADSLGALRVSYLRGDRSQEGASSNPFRRRTSLMGDIINSGPVYKKEADPSLVGDDDYLAFSKATATRTAALYVGANDGMLHALRASDGKELFAYVPLAVGKNLNQLTSAAYQHLPFVDGAPQVGEAKLGAAWRTVLASGMGGGAQGIFALDITNPDTFEDGSAGGSRILFEFTDQDDPMMGNVVTQPKIVKLKIPAATAGGAPSYKWFVATGSGYNNYVNDGAGRYSTTGDQALFLLSLDKAPGESWTEGSNYFKIVVPAASTGLANGLANPGFLVGNVGEAIALYCGDLQGQLWKFDFTEGLSSANISNNKLVKLNGGVRQPLFKALDSAGARQPITIAPLVTTAKQRGVMVVFGSGKFIEQTDASSSGTQAIYGVWDSGGATASDYGLLRSSLQQQTAAENASAVTITAANFALGTGSGEKRGWYFDLPNGRERIAVEGDQGLTSVTLNSIIPSSNCSGDGNGRSYTLNSLTGSAAGPIQASSSIGLLSRPNYISIDLDNAYTTRRADGTRKYTVRDSVVSTGTRLTSAGNISSQTTTPTAVQIASGRISWREIRNFKN